MRNVLTPEQRRALTLEDMLQLVPHQVKPPFPCDGRVPFNESIMTEDTAFGPMLMLKGAELPLQALWAFLEEHPKINKPSEKVNAILRNWPGLDEGKVATAVCYILYFPHNIQAELRRKHEGLQEMLVSSPVNKFH